MFVFIPITAVKIEPSNIYLMYQYIENKRLTYNIIM